MKDINKEFEEELAITNKIIADLPATCAIAREDLKKIQAAIEELEDLRADKSRKAENTRRAKVNELHSMLRKILAMVKLLNKL